MLLIELSIRISVRLLRITALYVSAALSYLGGLQRRDAHTLEMHQKNRNLHPRGKKKTLFFADLWHL